MTDPTTIDPQQMREIVQQAIQMAILAERGNQIRHAIVRNGWANPADDTYAALHETIRAEYDRQVDALTWLDGQPTPSTPAAVDPQQERGGDDAAARVLAYLDACVADAVPGATRYAIAMRLEGVPDEGRDELAADDLRSSLKKLGQLQKLLGIGVDREQWDAIAEAEGRRYEGEQADDTIVGWLAYRCEDMKAQRHTLLAELKEQQAELEQLRSASAEPIRNAGDYLIEADHAEDHWVTVTHRPCDRFIFGKPGDPGEIDAAALLSLMTAHHCATQQSEPTGGAR